VNVEGAGEPGRSGSPYPLSTPEPVWNSRTQWGAIMAGAFAGFAVVILMSTLGAALGIRAVTVNATDSMSSETARKRRRPRHGAAIWILLTSLATSLVGGWVLNPARAAPSLLVVRVRRPHVGGRHVLALAVASRASACSPALGGGAARRARAATGAPFARSARPRPGPSPDEDKPRPDAADKAAAMAPRRRGDPRRPLISIAATMFAAGWHRHTGTRWSEIRPRPAAPMV
jgi:hypothetical protein